MVTLSDEQLKDLEAKAKAANRDDLPSLDLLTDFQDAANPIVVLALVERIRDLEGRSRDSFLQGMRVAASLVAEHGEDEVSASLVYARINERIAFEGKP